MAANTLEGKMNELKSEKPKEIWKKQLDWMISRLKEGEGLCSRPSASQHLAAASDCSVPVPVQQV